MDKKFDGYSRASEFKTFHIPGKGREIMAPKFLDAYIETLLQKERRKLCQQLREKAITVPATMPVPPSRW